MSLLEDFFADAEEAIEYDLPTAKLEAGKVLEEWKNEIMFSNIFVYENREYRTDQDTYFLAQLDNKDLAKVIEVHYKEVIKLHREVQKNVDKCKTAEELEDIMQELFEGIEEET